MARRKGLTPTGDDAGGAVVSLVPPAPPPAPRVIHLHNVDALRVELGKVYRAVANGTMDSQVGTRLAYLIGELRKLHELDLIEKRLVALEALVEGSDHGST